MIDFSPLRSPTKGFELQKYIPTTKRFLMLALALHYDLDIPSMIRYLSGNYTKSHVDVPSIISTLRHFDVPPSIIHDVHRIYVQGSPSSFLFHETLDNFQRFRRYGNHSTVMSHIPLLLQALNKEDKYSYTIPLPQWLVDFIPHIHVNPQVNIVNPSKAPRIISDGTFVPDPVAISVNMMYANPDELALVYVDAFLRHLISIWNQHVTYPDDVILLFDDDVAAAFRLLKYHPDIPISLAPSATRF